MSVGGSVPGWTPSRSAAHGRDRLAAVGCQVLALLVLIAAVVFNQSAVPWRPNVVDDHLFAYHGWCVSQGARPYLDIWDNKPPGIWWLNAAAFRLFGCGIEPELILGSLAVFVTMAAFLGIARSAYHRSLLLPTTLVASVLLTHHLFECGGNRTETYVVACETLAVLGYMRWLRRGRLRPLFLAGSAAGAAPLFKQAGVAAGAALMLHLAWVQWRSRRSLTRGRALTAWAVLMVGMLLAPATAAAVLFAQGALGEALYAVGRFNRAYFAVGEASAWNLRPALVSYWPYLRTLSPVLLVAAGGLVWSFWLKLSRLPSGSRPRRGAGVFVLWVLLAFYLACVSPGRQGHHLMPVLPALGLLLLLPVHLLAGTRGLRRRLTASPGALGLLVAWGFLLTELLGVSAAEATRGWRTKPHWYSLRRKEPAAWEVQGAEIARLTRPDERIYVCGWSPGTYRYACRRAASRFATFEKLGQVGEHARFIAAEAETDLYRRPPRVLVMATGEYQGVLQHPERPLANWVLGHYRLHREVQGMTVLLRTD
jgi:hypothetical protein